MNICCIWKFYSLLFIWKTYYITSVFDSQERTCCHFRSKHLGHCFLVQTALAIALYRLVFLNACILNVIGHWHVYSKFICVPLICICLCGQANRCYYFWLIIIVSVCGRRIRSHLVARLVTKAHLLLCLRLMCNSWVISLRQ